MFCGVNFVPLHVGCGQTMMDKAQCTEIQGVTFCETTGVEPPVVSVVVPDFNYARRILCAEW